MFFFCYIDTDRENHRKKTKCNELKNEIETIIDEETVHLREFTELADRTNKYSDNFVYEMLLLDEERHASLAEGFL